MLADIPRISRVRNIQRRMFNPKTHSQTFFQRRPFFLPLGYSQRPFPFPFREWTFPFFHRVAISKQLLRRCCMCRGKRLFAIGRTNRQQSIVGYFLRTQLFGQSWQQPRPYPCSKEESTWTITAPLEPTWFLCNHQGPHAK